MILGRGSLFEAINGFTQFANMVRIVTINKALWLLHEHILRKSILEKDIVNI